jgi:TRAP-type C4-dicarboxylate transport system substrate-binding protein
MSASIRATPHRTRSAGPELVIGPVVINERTWQALSPEHRAIMTEAARTAECKGLERVVGIEEESERLPTGRG